MTMTLRRPSSTTTWPVLSVHRRRKCTSCWTCSVFLQEEVGGVLARPIGTEPDQNMRLGKKLKNALIEWKLAGDPGDRIDRQLLNVSSRTVCGANGVP